jgi:hypothetical protein
MMNMLIKNKKLAIIAAILTFIVGTALFTGIIIYILNIPLSGIWEGQNQLYFFSAVLLAAALASLIYGRGSTERASKAVKVLDESLEIEIKKNDMWKILRAVEQMPPFVVNQYISMNINAVEEFEEQIMSYKSKIDPEDLLKIRKIIETPVGELQKVSEKLYTETKMEHFKILAEPQAEHLITINLQALKKVLFDE